jgi:hypothetical protein
MDQMLTKGRIYKLIAAVFTFFLGYVFQSLLGNVLPFKDPTSLTLVIIILIAALVLTILLDMFLSEESRFQALSIKIDEIISYSKIKVEYVEDNFDGSSFIRAAELIEKASESLTFVSPWAPTAEYQPGAYSEKIRDAKQRYYESIKTQIDKFRTKDTLFHRRILQVPSDLFEHPSLSYTTDSIFVNYLQHASSIQTTHPRICQIRIASETISSHFTIIDNRYVILSTYAYLNNGCITRHGAIIIDDSQGKVIKYYNLLYQSLDAHSRPLEPQAFIGPVPK